MSTITDATDRFTCQGCGWLGERDRINRPNNLKIECPSCGSNRLMGAGRRSTITPTNVAPTATGYRLAAKLAPAIGTTEQIARTCSLIARSAATYARIQEAWCNVEMDDRTTARMEEREAGIERRIRELVADLPDTDDGPFTVHFSGDPRGYCVKITAPGESGRILRGKDWGGMVGVA